MVILRPSMFVISRVLVFLVWICFTGMSTPSPGQNFKAGAAKRVITPDPLLPVSGGMGIPHPATKKAGDLFVRALVLENNGVKIALVSIDNLGWPSALGDRSRKLIKNIPPENILIGATHTHSAPDAYGFPDETGKSNVNLDYLDWCVKMVAEAVNEAQEKMVPAVLKVAAGEAKGNISYNYYAERLYDPQCSVLQVLTSQTPQRPIATMVNYAIHPEVIGSKKGILSPDLCGPLYDRIEKEVGGLALFFNGALGGMVTADNRTSNSSERNDWEECVRIGNLLAEQALQIIQPAPILTDPTLSILTDKLSLPVDNQVMKSVLKNSPVNLMGSSVDSVVTQINLVTIGPARMLTIPGEALPNIGYFLKRKLPTDFPFLLGLTNDAFGYIMTPEDFGSFKVYNYITRTSLGENTYELYKEKVLKMIEQL